MEDTLKNDDGLGRYVLRQIRGCATDDQYIETLERVKTALTVVRSTARADALKEAAGIVKSLYHKSEVFSRWNEAIIQTSATLERAAADTGDTDLDGKTDFYTNVSGQ